MTEQWRLSHGQTGAISLDTASHCSLPIRSLQTSPASRSNHIVVARLTLFFDLRPHLVCTVVTDKNRFWHMQDCRVDTHIHKSHLPPASELPVLALRGRTAVTLLDLQLRCRPLGTLQRQLG